MDSARKHRVPLWYVAVVAGAAAMRLLELRVSSRNERRLPGAQPRPRAAAGDYPVMVATHVGLFVLPLLEVGRLHPRRYRPVVVGAAGALAGATLLRWWSIRSLGGAWNVRAVVPPDLEPVERGPYRYIRHPNYVAVALEMLALPLLGGAWRSAVVLTLADTAILARRIAAEEELLMQNAAYQSRFGAKPRFLPGLF